MNLIGLRQKAGLWRSNLSVTNGGTTAAEVLVTLSDATGKSLTSYNLTIAAGEVPRTAAIRPLPFLFSAKLPPPLAIIRA